jgi:hypothetical protein
MRTTQMIEPVLVYFDVKVAGALDKPMSICIYRMHLERKSSIEATDQLIKTRSTQAKNIMAYVCAACWFSTFLNAQSFASAVHIYLLD